MSAREGFRIDRKVPLALLFAVFMQAIAAIGWATYLEARVSALESTTLEDRQVSAQLARLEERVGAIRSDVQDIRQQLRLVVGKLVRN